MIIANRIKILITASLMFGLLAGITITKQFEDYAENCQIKYVSQDELMTLEQARIKQLPLESRQMFFGLTTKAAQLAAAIPREFEDKTTLVVFSTGVVTGRNVKSISKEVHQAVIAELQASTKTEATK